MADVTRFRFDPISNRVATPEDLDDLDVDINALGQAIDTTWGRSSTPLLAQDSVKFSLEGNMLVASYAGIVQFGTQRQMIDIKRRYSDESIRVINAHVSNVKKRYKDLCGLTLTVSELGTSDSLEIISTNFFNPCRKAYFRRKTVFEIS